MAETNNITPIQDSFEFFYGNGVISANILEGDEHVSIEFFPSSQSNESFESGEFNNIFLIDTLLKHEDSKYSWSTPKGIEDEELLEFRDCLEYFLKKYLANLQDNKK